MVSHAGEEAGTRETPQEQGRGGDCAQSGHTWNSGTASAAAPATDAATADAIATLDTGFMLMLATGRVGGGGGRRESGGRWHLRVL